MAFCTQSALSSDGRYLAFDMMASYYGPGKVCVKDMQTGAVTPVGEGTAPAISGNGQFVAYLGDDGLDLTNLQTGTTTLVSAAGSDPSLSNDGRYIAFTNSDPAGRTQVCVEDLQTGTLAPVGAGGVAGQGGSISSSGAISADGRYVVFQSRADDLPAGQTHAYGDVAGYQGVFVEDLQTGATTLVSRPIGDGNAQSWDPDYFQPSISGDGRYVDFGTPGIRANYDVFVKDMQTGSVMWIDAGNSAEISSNGQFAAVVSAGVDVVNLQTGATAGVAGSEPGYASISGDGQSVACDGGAYDVNQGFTTFNESSRRLFRGEPLDGRADHHGPLAQ